MSDKSKPKVHLVGQDGNVFNLLSICVNALRKAGQSEESQELQKRVFGCGSYDEALATMLEYVEEAGYDTEEEDGDYDCDED
jgi:hypothetical protein